jgi:hypothetical protein
MTLGETGRKEGEKERTVLGVHFLDFPDVLSTANDVVVESVEVCCGCEEGIRDCSGVGRLE